MDRGVTVGRFVLLSGLLLAAAAPGIASEAEDLARALGLQAGMTVADVGAGDGEWTEPLARRVGPAGRVFATEVDDDEIAKIEGRVRRSGLANVEVVRGSQEDTGLPAGCCDAVLLRMVYHHFTKPADMRQSLRRALRPGGRLVVVDTEPRKSWRRLAGVPERGGHGISASDLTAEMARDGFVVLERHEDWNGEDELYCVVFGRGEG